MGMKTVFASFDMARTRMYEKILYKVSGLGRDALYKIFKEDPEKEKELYQKVKEEFGNVYFFDKSAASVQDIKNYIEECNELAQSPEDKIKLVLIDYFEMISSDVGDDTASSKKVAQELQGIVNTMDVAQIVLLQPNKMSGDMREPIKSYTNIKGSSFLAQSFRIALGIFREGYDPQTPDNDKYLTINVLKNDLGETGSLNYNWNGKRGEISEMDQFDEEELIALRKRIALEKSPDNEGL
jgi:replicative DNA helicase